MQILMIAVQPLEFEELKNINLKDMLRIASAFAKFGLMVSPIEACALWVHRSKGWRTEWLSLDGLTDEDIVDQVGRLSSKNCGVLILASDEEGKETEFFSIRDLSKIIEKAKP